MIAANPALQVPSAFYDWMRIAYVNDMTLAIRRLVDWDKRSISFVRLIEEIADHPEVISRRRFVGSYPKPLRNLIADRDFERFASSNADKIDSRGLRRHRRELLQAQRRLRQFVNHYVAHRNRTPMRRLPTYAELDICIDVLGRLTQAYASLLEQTALVNLIPEIQYDWKKPFRVSWLAASMPEPVRIPSRAPEPWFASVLRDPEWTSDPTAKAREVAAQVIEELNRERDPATPS